MELNTIQQTGTWGEASDAINTNFTKVGVGIESLKDATVRNKGYYRSAEELASLNPTASVGSKAYVGTNYPYAIYLWDKDKSSWVDSGETGGDESVNLDDYYTKEEQVERETNLVNLINKTISDTAEDIRGDYDNVMSEAAYEALATKEDKFYYTYEEEE